jgi:putative transcriptional regulator
MRKVYQEIIEEFTEINEKGSDHLRRRTREYTPVLPLKKYSPKEIKALREEYQYTQSYFGEFLGVSIKTVQAWEAGTKHPAGTALRLLQILEQDPHAFE